MTDPRLYIRMIILLLMLGVTLVIWFPVIDISPATSSNLVVRFLDVGQGDSVHIITPDGYELLIDGGSSAAVLRELSDGRNFFDKKIDVVVATHPDADHVGGLVDVLERYEVGLIIESAVVHETTVSDAFDDAANNEGLDIVIAQAGQIIKLGASTTVRILSPYGDSANWNSNSASVIVQIVYGDIEFMLTGDAPKGIEEYLVGEFGELLESEVMKLGHHGSKTSSAETFLDAVSPEFAVVSAALDNRYGHPHPEVIERVEEREIEIVSTAVEGTIAFESDGREVWLVE